MKKNSLNKHKHGYLIHTWSIKAYRRKSTIAVFVWRVIWKYAYSPFKPWIFPHSSRKRIDEILEIMDSVAPEDWIDEILEIMDRVA